MTVSLLLVGCGKMGGAMLEGWFESRTVDRAVVVEPSDAAAPRSRPGLERVRAASDLPSDFVPDAVVLAVKPQAMDQVVPDYVGRAGPGTVFISVAAGKTLGYFARHFGDAAIVRAMPNTPAAVRRGMTVACANGRVASTQRALADALLRAVGDVAWVDDEGLLDAVTAVSGGGPAYVFLLIETLARAGERAGLPPDLAMHIARATVIGSGELARVALEPAEILRRNVTSPNGTTAAALSVLMAPDGLQPLFDHAVAAATRRSRELAD